MTSFPNTNSSITRGTGDNEGGRTSSGLSTQIIIKINGNPVGAMQNFTVTQARSIGQVTEIGTDGIVELVPNQATTYNISANRLVFDHLRLPEAFSRGFRFIAAQRIPFDIDVMDVSRATPDVNGGYSPEEVTTMKFVNCWFSNYSTPYQSDNYLITETSTILAEHGYVVESGKSSWRELAVQTDSVGLESALNEGNRRGGLSAGGIVDAIFNGS